MKKNKIFLVVIGVVALILIVGVVYWFLNKPLTVETSDGKVIEISAEDERDIKALRKIYDLPKDAIPMMAKVTDPDALRAEQPVFFADAEKGDRVAVFADVAVLYDPKIPKIKHIGPVNFDDSKNKIPFAVYNGTDADIADEAFIKTINATFSDAIVVSNENAVGDYPKTLVVDLVGDNPEIETIAKLLGASVSKLPEGEKTPENTAVLVIVGQDYADALIKK